MAQAACPDGVQVAFMPTLGAATEEMQILGSRGLKGQVYPPWHCVLWVQLHSQEGLLHLGVERPWKVGEMLEAVFLGREGGRQGGRERGQQLATAVFKTSSMLLGGIKGKKKIRPQRKQNQKTQPPENSSPGTLWHCLKHASWQ